MNRWKEQPDGTQIIIVRNGVNIQMRLEGAGDRRTPESDSVVIWRRKEGRQGPGPARLQPNQLVDNNTDPLEFYLEGHVIFRQDQPTYQGKSDQRTLRGEPRLLRRPQGPDSWALNATVELFAPGLVTPAKVKSPRILQYHPQVAGDNGQLMSSTLAAMQIDKAVTTGSRFANPGYRFTSNSVDVEQVVDNRELENTDRTTPFNKDDLTWLIDARTNLFFVGPIPVFYLPRFRVEADDLNPPIQGISFATNNFFGQQFRTDYDMFNLLGQRHPPEIDVWNLDVDLPCAARDKKDGQGIASGTEIGWYGSDLINDLNDPWHKKKNWRRGQGRSQPPEQLRRLLRRLQPLRRLARRARRRPGGHHGLAEQQRGRSGGVHPALQPVLHREPRHLPGGRHRPPLAVVRDQGYPARPGFPGQRRDRLLLRPQLPGAVLQAPFRRRARPGEPGLPDQAESEHSRLRRFLAETNLQTWQTETQWYPKGDYYRLGDSLLGNRLTYFQHTGADYANVHTAAEVNNKTIFAYLPIDPISNTKGTFESGRLYTAHEVDLPINFGFMRVTPYVQGQAVGWNNQDRRALGRPDLGRDRWGPGPTSCSMEGDIPNVESELFNIHGLNHKIDFVADFRDAYSNVPINSLGVQDDLDDNALEYTRRYFALTNYVGGLLPAQYDPRALLLRRGLSPITGTTDIQASIETLKLGIHQRLQTKRGQEGRRHINDYMVFDLDTTYFPNAARDNFNKPFGQNFYNFEWYIGDRTSILSYGWFEFWKVGGDPYLAYNTSLDRNDPFGLHIITSGISITRIPKGNIFIGYSIVNTGPINTSALNAQYSYWLSPKWFGTVSESYDFGNHILLAATGSLTRIGADYLTSVGLSVIPLTHTYQFVVSISPRLSPNMQFGSSSGITRLDSRFAPVE